MSESPVRREDVGLVAVLSLCRPPTNAADATLIEALSEQVARIEVDDSRAVVVRSTVEGFFMAGADIKAMLEAIESGDRATIARMRQLTPVLDQLEALPKPTVAAIGGVAAGGGLELALACDLRIAGAGARLGLPEIRLGLLPGAGGTQRLTRLVGPGRALDLMLGGRLVDGEAAEKLGIVTRVVEDAAVEAEAFAIAAGLADASQVATRAIREAVRAAASGDAAAGRKIEQAGIEAALWSDEGKAGLQAFLAKRRGQPPP